MPAASTPMLLTLNYVATILSPAIVAAVAGWMYPKHTAGAVVLAVAGWLAYCTVDAAELGTGSPDKEFTQNHWVFVRLREYISLKLHRTSEVQSAIMEKHPKGQAIFAFFPHGVNSDFRVLMDGMMYDAFPKTYEKSPARTLAATILFKLPGVRSLSLKTGCG